jgi:hypothetical protein
VSRLLDTSMCNALRQANMMDHKQASGNTAAIGSANSHNAIVDLVQPCDRLLNLCQSDDVASIRDSVILPLSHVLPRSAQETSRLSTRFSALMVGWNATFRAHLRFVGETTSAV